MFQMTELKATVRIDPESFDLELQEAIKKEINKKLANKVLINVGLCILATDIISIGDSKILPGDGGSHTEVIFRYIVFRPLIGEILTGKIRSCSREGVFVTLGFFDDIFIPADALQHPSRFEEAEQAWVWEYSLEEGEKHDLFMDLGELIKFRVVSEHFEDNTQLGPKISDQAGTSSNAEETTPYRLCGSVNESGLGLLSWWDSNQNEELDEEENSEEEENEIEEEDNTKEEKGKGESDIEEEECSEEGEESSEEEEKESDEAAESQEEESDNN